MSNSYTWAVTSMSTLPNVPNMPNYVVLVNGTLTGSNGATPAVTASIGWNVQLVVEQSDPNFIPYANLTETIVLGWAQAVLTPQGVANLKANVDGQINSIVNPPVTPSQQPLPWAANATISSTAANVAA